MTLGYLGRWFQHHGQPTSFLGPYRIANNQNGSMMVVILEKCGMSCSRRHLYYSSPTIVYWLVLSEEQVSEPI